MIVYFISGLGSDERAFRYIRLPGVEKRFIRWTPPRKHESLRQYSGRLIEQIDTRRPVTLVGLSFGGIVAQVLAESIPCEQIILISSVKHPRELRRSLRFIRRTGAYRVVPVEGLKPLFLRLAPYWFDAVSGRHKKLLRTIVNDTDAGFAQWAIGAIMRWNGSHLATPTIRIHGTQDRVFPIRYLTDYVPVEGGGHFMVVTHARRLSQLLQYYLNPVTQ